MANYINTLPFAPGECFLDIEDVEHSLVDPRATRVTIADLDILDEGFLLSRIDLISGVFYKLRHQSDRRRSVTLFNFKLRRLQFRDYELIVDRCDPRDIKLYVFVLDPRQHYQGTTTLLYNGSAPDEERIEVLGRLLIHKTFAQKSQDLVDLADLLDEP